MRTWPDDVAGLALLIERLENSILQAQALGARGALPGLRARLTVATGRLERVKREQLEHDGLLGGEVRRPARRELGSLRARGLVR